MNIASRLLTPQQDFILMRWLFIRGLGLIYAIAFLSLWLQIGGLLGSNGILPAGLYLEAIEQQFGPERYWFFPTLFWVNQSNVFLHVLCALGFGSSLLLIFRLAPFYSLLTAWAVYLSLVTIGQDFLSFQWDVLLLETGLLTLFLAPKSLKPTLRAQPPTLLGVWLLRWLLFRLMFLSGIVKWLSGDSTWQNLTALFYHYETQPLPTVIGWYVHHLPYWFHQASCLAMFVIEVAVPFLIFITRRLRIAAAVTFAVFQIMILLTGNYCFFNLLTILLCLPLLDDRALSKFLPVTFLKKMRSQSHEMKKTTQATKGLSLALAALIFLLGNLLLLRDTIWYGAPPKPVQKIARWISPLRSINSYGLFRVMTTTRNEIIIQGSRDQTDWKTYDFKWKPDDVAEAPCWVAPHQPRLDWQMWFAALGHFRQNPWFLNFMEKLLKGSEEVTKLLQKNPFPDAPPRYIRAQLYQYEFSDLNTKRTTGKWWVRRYKGLYCPTLSLRE